MNRKTLYSSLLFLALSLQLSFGQVVKDTAVIDYGIINKTILEKVQKYGAGNVLVVMDIDNTILTGDTDLGSDLWYQWQRGELDIKPAPDQKLADNCLFGEAIGMLYELGTMSLTDTLLPGYIHSWQASGVTLFALTSRSPDYRAATERELGRNKIDLSVAELKSSGGHKLLLDYQSSNRKISYLNGIMMTSGMNKGNMLADILDSAGISYKAIIFIDDTRKNIDAVKNKYLSNNQADMVLFNYTGIMSARLKKNNNMVLTPKQAKKMDHDWDKLIRTLNAVFPERIERPACAKSE